MLLLDEPTASLDPENARRVEGLLRTCRAEHDAAILWVTHDHGQVARMAEFGYSLVEGQLQDEHSL